MHPPRPLGLSEIAAPADRLAESLLTYCPLSTLTGLILVVAGSAVAIPRPLPLLAAVVLGDLAINAVRRRRKRE
jgi:hypothetical protein